MRRKVARRCLPLLAVMACLGMAHADAPKLSEPLQFQAQIHVLKAENAQLRALLADAQAKLASAQLSAERADLERQIREALGCAADAPINWQVFTDARGGAACSPAPKP